MENNAWGCCKANTESSQTSLSELHPTARDSLVSGLRLRINLLL